MHKYKKDEITAIETGCKFWYQGLCTRRKGGWFRDGVLIQVFFWCTVPARGYFASARPPAPAVPRHSCSLTEGLVPFLVFRKESEEW